MDKNSNIMNDNMLAPKHTGMKVSAEGMLGRIRDGWAVDESLRYTCGELLDHLKQLGQRFYAGDVKVVDEFLQLYSLDDNRPKPLATTYGTGDRIVKLNQKIIRFDYLPDADIEKGLLRLKELVFDNIACDHEQKYLVVCWAISAFVADFLPYKALMQFTGAQGSGKTIAARLLSRLFYSHERSMRLWSINSAYRMARNLPLIIWDGFDHITKDRSKFLKMAATGGSSGRLKPGSDTETTEGRLRALVLITSIEPATEMALINRTYEIEFSREYHRYGFNEDQVFPALAESRNLILSAIYKIIQAEVVPNWEKRNEYLEILETNKNHAGNKKDDHLPILGLILNILLKYMPYHNHVPKREKAIAIYKTWIECLNLYR